MAFGVIMACALIQWYFHGLGCYHGLGYYHGLIVTNHGLGCYHDLPRELPTMTWGVIMTYLECYLPWSGVLS